MAVLIDLDDTIISDSSLGEGVWRTVCSRYAPLIGKITADELYAVIRTTANAYWADPENHRRGRLDLYQTRRKLVAQALNASGLGSAGRGYEIADAFTAEKDRLIAPVPGAIDTLIELKKHRVRMALITNGGSDVQRRKIERFGLAAFFDYILIEGEFGAGKPDKMVFQSVLQHLEAQAGESWMIGDDINRDIGGAMQLGIHGIWVDWRQNGLPPGIPVTPDRIIHTFAELLVGYWQTMTLL